jgi:alpha-tubulin suppressor-like RCC1 family protein
MLPVDEEDGVSYQPIPQPVPGIKDAVVCVACASANTFAVTAQGTLLSWGSAAYGVLGLDEDSVASLPLDSTGNLHQPTPRALVAALRHVRVLGVAAGDEHAACWGEGGEVFTWGSGTSVCPQLFALNCLP